MNDRRPGRRAGYRTVTESVVVADSGGHRYAFTNDAAPASAEHGASPIEEAVMHRMLPVILSIALSAGVAPAEAWATQAEPLPQQSLYVPMRDGTRLAVDVLLPPAAGAARVPTVLVQTRYWRRHDTPSDPALGDGDAAMKAYFASRGYAVVYADVRGSGASFGSREVEVSAAEVRDGYDLVSWIVAQPWSDGAVGSVGISYLGLTSELVGTVGHPAVRAVVPQFSEWDLYADIAWPGGVLNAGFLVPWGRQNDVSDRGLFCDDGSLECAAAREIVVGVAPVDADPNRTLLTRALAEHRANRQVQDYIPALRFRDSRDATAGFTLDERSPFWHQIALARGDAAVFGWGSWYDGRTADSVLLRYESLPELEQTAVIGPWNHGALELADPFRPGVTAVEPSVPEQWELIALFFDRYLKRLSTYAAKRSIWYYTLGKGWQVTERWPPIGTRATRMYTAGGGTLATRSPAVGESTYAVDYDATTGSANRWTTQLGGESVTYGDRRDADRKLLTFDGEPFARATELSGHPVVALALAIDRTDAAVYAYLETVAPDGRVTHLTDGMLRVQHRAERAHDPSCFDALPCHAYLAADARPATPGETMRIRFAMHPVSALVPQGHRLRVAIAGHDASMFERVPESGATTFRLRHGSDGSSIELPIVTQ